MRNRRRRFTTKSEPDDLNVIPVMNLFMVLIPFLLLGAAFYQIGVIPTSTPTHDPTASDIPETPTTVSANLLVEPDAITVTFASTSLNEEELAEIAGRFSREGGEYDVDGLQRHLRTIKERYPESTTMTVLPHDRLDYQTLVTILDAAREYPVNPDDPLGEHEELFPVTVFSKLITDDGASGDAPPEGGE